MDSQWLKMQFSLNPNRSKADLAKALGLEPPAISKILKGTRQIKAQEYIEMRRFFGMPLDGERSLKKESGGYKISTLEGHGTFSDSESTESQWVIPAAILSNRTQATPEQIRIFQIKENMMEPDFKQGEWVLVDLSDRHPSPPGTFIISDGFGHMVRQCEFVPGSKPPQVKVSAHSGSFKSQTLKLEDFKVIGKVIAKLQML